MTTATAAEPRSEHFRSKRLRLHYNDWGNPGAPLMMMLHGGLEHGRAWDRLAVAFRHDYHIVCPDLRGHGDSDWSTGGAYSVFDSVQDIACLMRHLDCGQAVMIGHSFGGNVAVRYTALFPEQVVRLVAIEGLVMAPDRDDTLLPGSRIAKLRAWMDAQVKIDAIRPRRYRDVAEAAARIQTAYPRVAHELTLEIARHGLKANADGTLSWKYDDNIRGGGPTDITYPELQSLWRAIPHPVLLMYGAESWATNPAVDGRAEFFQRAEVALIPGAGHNVQHDQPERTRTAIATFLAETAALQL